MPWSTPSKRPPVSFAEKAIQQISQNLTRAVEHGKDRKARMAMANGSLLAGAAFSNSMVGLVHAIGHALGGVCHVAHGEAMTILLPAVMKYNLEQCHKRYGELLLYVAGPEVYAATPEAQRAQKTIDTLIALRQHLADVTGLPTTLVKSYWELGDILHFDPDTARRNIELGYYDTRRAMGYLRGCAYAVSCDAQSCQDAAAFAWQFGQLQKFVREKYPVTLTADAALRLANLKDASLAPLEAAAEDAGVDPTVYYTTETLSKAFLEKCDRERLEVFAPLFEGTASAPQAARAALLPNTFLQALVCRVLTGPALPEVTVS